MQSHIKEKVQKILTGFKQLFQQLSTFELILRDTTLSNGRLSAIKSMGFQNYMVGYIYKQLIDRIKRETFHIKKYFWLLFSVT